MPQVFAPTTEGAESARSLIVVVDDRASNREIFARLAASTAADIDVKTFSDPAATLAWLADNVPDLVITDFKMPGMSGAEFISRLRLLHEGADLPVIVITAHEDRAYRFAALEAGATDFLQSPVDHQEFVTRARNLLRLSHQQRELRRRADHLSRELEESERSREQAIRDSRLRLAEVIDTIPALISAVDPSGREVFVNSYGSRMIGGGVAKGLQHDALVRRTMQAVEGIEQEFIDQDGRRRTMLTSKFPLRAADGTAALVLTTAFDITHQKAAEQAMKRLAHEDMLTGLPNRLALHTILAVELSATPDSQRHFALHFIDLDRFKSINDAFGHDHGDKLLFETATRLRQFVRKGDLVVRLGGDEFALVQFGVDTHEEAALLSERIVAGLKPPVTIEHRSVSVGASAGFTLFPSDGNTVEQLMKNADLAMYAAKSRGRGRSCAFASDMQTTARDKVLLELDLREGIERNELTLEYQPQINFVAGRVVGAEALLRWRRLGGDLVYPGAFLPMAEASGLISIIEQWVLREACRQAAIWSRSGCPVRVAVNLSSSAFRTQDVRLLVETVLSETGLEPTLLELELTETTLLENQSEVAEELSALRRLGVQVAIDDFGTGFSSLAYLRMLPVDRLKIDRSFISGLGSDPGDTAIVRAIIGIGRSLGLDVLAEGVETRDQLNRLHQEGCLTIQGHLYSVALTPDDLAAYLQGRRKFPTVS